MERMSGMRTGVQKSKNEHAVNRQALIGIGRVELRRTQKPHNVPETWFRLKTTRNEMGEIRDGANRCVDRRTWVFGTYFVCCVFVLF